MKKLSFRVSGSRLGESVRPVASDEVADVVSEVAPVAIVAPVAPRFGLRARTPFVPAPKAAVALTADDYATLEDYT